MLGLDDKYLGKHLVLVEIHQPQGFKVLSARKEHLLDLRMFTVPGSTKEKPHYLYEVIKPIAGVESGKSAPWFGEPGGGLQHELPKSIDELIEEGYLKREKKFSNH